MAIKVTKPAQSIAKMDGVSKYAAHLTSTPAIGTVHKVKAAKSIQGAPETIETDTTEVVHPGISVSGAAAMVTVGGSQTINTGNYSSVRITVELAMPSDPAQIDITYEFASEWVSQKMKEATKGLST